MEWLSCTVSALRLLYTPSELESCPLFGRIDNVSLLSLCTLFANHSVRI